MQTKPGCRGAAARFDSSPNPRKKLFPSLPIQGDSSWKSSTWTALLRLWATLIVPSLSYWADLWNSYWKEIDQMWCFKTTDFCCLCWQKHVDRNTVVAFPKDSVCPNEVDFLGDGGTKLEACWCNQHQQDVFKRIQRPRSSCCIPNHIDCRQNHPSSPILSPRLLEALDYNTSLTFLSIAANSSSLATSAILEDLKTDPIQRFSLFFGAMPQWVLVLESFVLQVHT